MPHFITTHSINNPNYIKMQQNKNQQLDAKFRKFIKVLIMAQIQIPDLSQNFKNLMFNTRHDRVAGLGNSEGSQRALNLLYAIRTIKRGMAKTSVPLSSVARQFPTHLRSCISCSSTFAQKNLKGRRFGVSMRGRLSSPRRQPTSSLMSQTIWCRKSVSATSSRYRNWQPFTTKSRTTARLRMWELTDLRRMRYSIISHPQRSRRFSFRS